MRTPPNRFGGLFFASVFVLLTSIFVSSKFIYHSGVSQQRNVEKISDAESCGRCLDVMEKQAVKHTTETFDISFINCPENLKKWSILGVNGAQYIMWDEYQPTQSAELMNDYSLLNKAGFQRGFESTLFKYSRQPHFNKDVLVVIAINAGMPTILALTIFCGFDGEWKMLCAISNTIWLYYIAWSALYTMSQLEIQSMHSFENADCMIIPSGYSFYSMFLLLPTIFSAYTFVLLFTHFFWNGGNSYCGRFWLSLYLTWPFVLLVMDAFFLAALYKSHSHSFYPILGMTLIIFSFTIGFFPMLALILFRVDIIEMLPPIFTTPQDFRPLMP